MRHDPPPPFRIAPFIVLGLPRSRTAWLSKFLSYGDWSCGHEELRHCRTLEDVGSWLSQPNTGTAETAGTQFWRLIPTLCPDARVLIVHRPADEVLRSLVKLGADSQSVARWLPQQEAKLRQAARRLPNVRNVTFESLRDERVCAELFEYCIPYRHDHDWWQVLQSINIQISWKGLTRYAEAFRPQLLRLANAARSAILRDLSSRRVVVPDSLVVAVESIESLLRDGQAAFADHAAQVGEDALSWKTKNLDLMKTLESVGALQTTVARSNGKVFGYLQTIISPSMEDATKTSAIHTLFYASSEFPGLGLRLQRFALDALRPRIDEMWFRAGPRGDGPRTSVLARRQGAVADGELYRLQVGRT